ncbi:hypothetical protein [Rhizobium sp. BT-226]|uniref:hypothetical protein n=1 Tax=Rhizobium sp. BT-226 TaxID=2986922 RepID=UPI0021F74B76|nr:hypothetical protein [Rhizobium sp. BT-226]MCW0021364.1 hypothetical protein [Rhizobium sp. BT-226]
MSDKNNGLEAQPKRSLRIVSAVRHPENDDLQDEEPFYQDLAEEELVLLRESYALYQQEALSNDK